MTDRLTVTVAVEGGIAPFPGLARPYAVDAAELPAKDAAELARLVDESGFFELPQQRPHGGPDARTYTVTVQRGTKSRTLTLTDPLPNTALRRLINIVEQRRRAR